MALADLVADLAQHADERLLAGWYRAISVNPDRVRRQLKASGHHWLDPAVGTTDLRELDRSATWVIAQSRFGATTIGGVAGMAGAAGVPTEVLAQFVSTLRMAQRLALVYGFDPSTDRGRMALSRALAAGFDVDLPEKGPVGMRVSDLPSVVAPSLISPRTVGTGLLGSILRKSAWTLAARVSRLVPVAGAGVAALDARRDRAEIGERMRLVLRQLAEVKALGLVEEAVEVAPSGGR